MESPILDCESVDTAILTTAAILQLDPSDLEQFLKQIRREEHNSAPLEQWALGAVTNSLGARRYAGWSYTHYLHGTRVIEPDSLLSGIEPLDVRLDTIWETLRGIVEQPLDDWHRFRYDLENEQVPCSSAFLYPSKVDRDNEMGPFGFLVREALLVDNASRHDFMRGPEIVEDILRCFDELNGTQSLAAYVENSTPCIVKFRHEDATDEALGCALAYVEQALTDTAGNALELTVNAARVIPQDHIEWVQVFRDGELAKVLRP